MTRAEIRAVELDQVAMKSTAEQTPASLSPVANFAALGSSEVIGRAVGFYAAALLARKLGVDAFGYLGFALAITSYFGIALTVGFADIGAREVARNPAAAKQLAADGTAVKLAIALTGIGAVGILAFVLALPPTQRVVLLVSSPALAALALDTTWVYRGLSRNPTAGLALLLAQLAYLAGVLIFVSAPRDVARVPLIQLTGDLLAALGLLALLFGRSIPRPSFAGGMALVRQSGFITVSRLFRTLIVTSGVLLLGLMAGSRDVGLYTASYRICLFVATVVVATHVVFLPAMSRASLEGPKRVTEVLSRSLSLTSAVILPVAAGGIVLAEPLLAFFFGHEYAAGAAAFRLLLASIVLLAIHGTAHNIFIALKQTRREAVIWGGGAVINMALNLILIPSYGFTGVAFATLVAEASIMAVSAASLHRWGIEIDLSGTKLPLAASAVMSAVLILLESRMPVLLLVLLGGLTYLLVFSAAGGIRRLRDSGVDMAAAPD